MDRILTLSRNQLHTFLICRRRFQLRYLERLPWPTTPLDPEQETAVARGQYFHQLLERHFLGLAVAPEMFDDDLVRQWWNSFRDTELALPQGRPLPELSLTVPVDGHLLTGRFDLLIVGEREGRPFAHVFDWKTSRPQAETTLRSDWQTRLYLALLAESGSALLPDERTFAPDDLAITYWYVGEPDRPRTVRYSSDWHAQNWAEIRAIVQQIDARSPEEIWPLTDDWSHCRVCAYQVICGRQEAAAAAAPAPVEAPLEEDDLPETADAALALEPETP